MKITRTIVDQPELDVTVYLEDGPVVRGSQVHSLVLTYTASGEGHWDTETRHDVVLYGKDAPIGFLPEDEFGAMDEHHPWLFDLIDHLAPKGDVQTTSYEGQWPRITSGGDPR